jgi:hypothetical protein
VNESFFTFTKYILSFIRERVNKYLVARDAFPLLEPSMTMSTLPGLRNSLKMQTTSLILITFLSLLLNSWDIL